ncbi:MAG: thioredoxin family protein [Bacteroidota bacterium]
MAAITSTMLPLGTLAPDFSLPAANPDVAGETVALADWMDGAKGLVVVFTCNHCPFAIHVEDRVIELAKAWNAQGVRTVAISSNDVEAYPQDDLPHMAERAAEKGYPFPYLYDESQDVARAYDAACTPDFYLFDADRQLVYRGRLDDSRPARHGQPGSAPTTDDLNDAVQALLDGRPVSEAQIPSMGCNIKWREMA